jgi:hypothetical protein
MEKKQSSIDWVVEKLENLIPQGNQIAIGVIFEQAKAMHEKEIIKSSARGYVIASDGFPLQEAIDYAKQYYNETFGGNNE